MRDVAIWGDFMEKTKLNSRTDRGMVTQPGK